MSLLEQKNEKETEETMPAKEVGIFIMVALCVTIIEFGLIHRHLFCSRKNKCKCKNVVCDYYGICHF